MASSECIDRMTENLCMIFAVRGSNSEIWMPGTDVEIDLKLPRTSLGASGLGSNVSSWLAPPFWNNTIQETSLRLVSFASSRGRSIPANARPPILRKLRRLALEPIGPDESNMTILRSVVELKFLGIQNGPENAFQSAS